ncbi:hypothetical protein M426DRAFT_321656 [Hypoxylon sp. CI-4A]|nr:hypothetical protein M426DRAFT_321656 [Hypoxylon sp. CI-4A]
MSANLTASMADNATDTTTPLENKTSTTTETTLPYCPYTDRGNAWTPCVAAPAITTSTADSQAAQPIRPPNFIRAAIESLKFYWGRRLAYAPMSSPYFHERTFKCNRACVQRAIDVLERHKKELELVLIQEKPPIWRIGNTVGVVVNLENLMGSVLIALGWPEDRDFFAPINLVDMRKKPRKQGQRQYVYNRLREI